MLLVLIFHKPMLSILFGRTDKDVMKAAVTYFVFSGLSYPFLAVYNSCASLFRSMGNSRITLAVSIFMNLGNVIGDATGIFLFHAGVTGVGIATLTARATAAALIMGLSLNSKNEVFARFQDIFKWDGKMILRILNIAVPNGIENGIYQLGRVLLISLISMFGTAQIAANGITNSLVMIAISFASAVNLAIVTAVGQCVGAGDYPQATYYIKKLVRITYIGTVLLSLSEILFLPLILHLYSLTAEVSHLTYILVVIHNGFAVFLWPLAFTLSNGLRAAGDVRFTMIVSICSMFVLRISCAYVLAIFLHMWVIGVWIAMGLDWTFCSTVFITRFKLGKWKSFKVI